MTPHAWLWIKFHVGLFHVALGTFYVLSDNRPLTKAVGLGLTVLGAGFAVMMAERLRGSRP